MRALTVDPGARTGARSVFGDRLLMAETPEECAQAGIDWLATHTNAADLLVGWLDDDGRWGGAVGRGALKRMAVRPLKIDGTDHPLVRASRSRKPAVLEEGSLGTRDGGVVALALRGPDRVSFEEGRWRPDGMGITGAILAGPYEPELIAPLRWIARRLGYAIGQLRLRARLAASQQQLAMRSELLEKIIHAVPDPIILSDAEGGRQLVNRAAANLLTAAEASCERGRRAVGLNHALFESTRPRKVREMESRELFLVSPEDGSELLFEHISTRAGSGGGVVSVLRNVTALRRATGEIQTNYERLQSMEASSRAERDRLDLVLASVTDPIIVTDPDGRVALMNRPAERLFEAEETPPPDPAQQAARENRRQFTRFSKGLLDNELENRLIGSLVLTDPEKFVPIHVQAHAGKLLSESGALSGIVTILHDQTEPMEKARLYVELQKASAELEEKVQGATEELLRQNELLQRQHLELEQASALKTQFLANMSHEFRTPLNAILGYTSMLLQNLAGEMPSQARRSLSRVDSNARHLLTIINDILDISRIESGRMPLNLSEFSLQDLVSEVMAEVEPLIEKSNLAVRAEVDPGLVPMRCDRPKLKQVLLNLLTNALKFTHEGSVRVVARHEDATDHVVMSVIDTGIGIAEADRGRIFEDFRQADSSTTREYGGTGLGLAIVRRLAEMLDGRIELDSRVGEGSRFTVTLPRRLRKR